ncbi:glutathione S-transferase [Mycena belliarum]|uniref:glutathione transferase n=1 Tax=Mycena belliarum TaxID=1033014 RepID=A0AAD6XR16_9AGAR|nr:glutathione S-transferase [Mycena belliae]
MVLRLFGGVMSTCTRRVALVLVEKKVPFEFIAVDLTKGAQKAPSYMENQPFGQVPYIVGPLPYLRLSHAAHPPQDDDGFVLFESRAICRYIAEKYASQGTPLVPAVTDVRGRALFEQAASIEFANHDPFASKAVFEMLVKPMLGLPSDSAVFNALIAGLSAKLDAYEVILGKQKYLAGDEVTLADLFHIPHASMLKMAGSDLMTTKGPNVARWFNDITTRPAWLAVKDGCKSFPSY